MPEKMCREAGDPPAPSSPTVQPTPAPSPPSPSPPPPTSGGDCPELSAECEGHLNWAMNTGIKNHPDWYPDLTSSSSPEEFQQLLSERGLCPEPCTRTSTAPTPLPTPE